MKLTGRQLEEIKRDVERDIRFTLITELEHLASHEEEGSRSQEMLLKAAAFVKEGNRLWVELGWKRR